GISYLDCISHRITLFPYTTLFRSDPLRERVEERIRDRNPPSGFARERVALDGEAIAEHGHRVGSFDRAVVLEQPVGRKVEAAPRSEEHTSELQSRENLVCRLLLEK